MINWSTLCALHSIHLLLVCHRGGDTVICIFFCKFPRNFLHTKWEALSPYKRLTTTKSLLISKITWIFSVIVALILMKMLHSIEKPQLIKMFSPTHRSLWRPTEIKYISVVIRGSSEKASAWAVLIDLIETQAAIKPWECKRVRSNNWRYTCFFVGVNPAIDNRSERNTCKYSHCDLNDFNWIWNVGASFWKLKVNQP